MSGETLGLIELVVVFGLALAFGVHQLWTLRKYRGAKDAQKNGTDAGDI